MGLRTASVRRSNALVMAPALTETNQTTASSFKLPPSQSPSSKIAREGATCIPSNGKELHDVLYDVINELVQCEYDHRSTADRLKLDSGASAAFMMSEDPFPMDEDANKMGLQKAQLDDVLLKDGKINETDEDLFPDLPISTSDIVHNEDDIMQVIKSMEGAGNDRLESVAGDLGSDPIFPLSASDLSGNLEFGKEFFNDVDVLNMNMSMDEQLIDNASIKETQTKDLLAEVSKRQVKLERKMEFLLRRARKLQIRDMGQHISGEVAGVFEHVHRTLRRCKELPAKQEDSLFLDPPNPPPEEIKPTPADKLKPISYSSSKNLVKKLELSTVVQANNNSRPRHSARYFGSGSLDPSSYRVSVTGLTTLPQWAPEEKQEFQRVSGYLESELRLVQDELDSEATVSSSGGESCDELQSYNNPHQQYLPIHKRAAWKWAVERAAIASRWTWLQSQIADLEYRIRQHSELHRKIRESKESVRLGGMSPPHNSVPSSPTCVNGYRGQLPGASPSAKNAENQPNGTITSQIPDYQCARTRPVVNFRKRKLLQFTGLHVISKKAARPSTIRCGCIPPDVTCALCTGRTDPTHPRDISDYLSKNEKLGLLDPSYHPVFSLNEDASAILHMEAIMKTTDWQQRSSRANLKSMKFTKGERLDKPGSSGVEHRPRKMEHRKKYNNNRLATKNAVVNALSAKIKNRFKGGRKPSTHRPTSSLGGRLKKRSRALSNQLQPLGSDGADEEVESLGVSSIGKFDSPITSPLLSTQSISGFQRRNRTDSYDIDNIIIPYSVASSTRVEKLQYKEILTPKWRIAAELEYCPKYECKNNGIVKASQENNEDEEEQEVEEGEEDLTDDSVVIRHEKCEQDEKKKFLSYLKLPIGYGRSRANRRTDSRAESSGANTPDPMSPAPVQQLEVPDKENTVSPLTSPPSTPLPQEDLPLPSISALRRRTVSQSRVAKDKDLPKDESRCNTPDQVEIQPYDKRLFPLHDETYEKMIKSMPEEHKLKTNIRSQDSSDVPSPPSDYDEKLEDYHDSESTESAFGDEDPNDPEWDVEHVKDRYRR